MQFPPGDVVASFGMYLHFQSLAQVLEDRHPEIAERVSVPESAPLYVKIDLGHGQSALLALTKIDHVHVWAVVTPRLDERPIVWPLNGNREETLVDCLHAAATANLEGRPMSSPWRWGEPEVTPIVALADLLDGTEVAVHKVVDANGYYTYLNNGQVKIGIEGTRRLSHLDCTYRQFALRISHEEGMGCQVDTYDLQRSEWTRLRPALTWGNGSEPLGQDSDRDTSPAALKRFADSILSGPDTWDSYPPWRPACAPFRQESSQHGASRPPHAEELFSPLEPSAEEKHHDEIDPAELAQRFQTQLMAFGLVDIRAGQDKEPLTSDSHHIVWHNRGRKLSMPEVQRLFGLAAADDKQLIVLSELGATRPAREFADRAKALVFTWHPATGELFGGNSRATKLLFPRLGDFEQCLELQLA
ncbi:hypothetical protein [Streptomyces qinglanensis]|uniref:hypothetical protein n=1 Tax=Streptomyces qinglanensis TaxID=943816 RepID=UPI0037AFD811